LTRGKFLPGGRFLYKNWLVEYRYVMLGVITYTYKEIDDDNEHSYERSKVFAPPSFKYEGDEAHNYSYGREPNASLGYALGGIMMSCSAVIMIFGSIGGGGGGTYMYELGW